jgi:glycine/D-amino acid oxidase-like deaminating enzyme
VSTREYLARDEAGTVNGGVSFWYRQIGIPSRGPALPGDRSADVCIVGGGLTGLWTAYHLAGAQPDLRVVVLEKEFAGYGASGRNGGWLSAELAGSLDRYAATGSRDGVRRLVRTMEQTVDDVIQVCRDEGIDADIVKDGVLHVARTEPQLARLDAMLAERAAWGFGEGGERRLTRAEVHDRVRVEGALAAVHSPHAARVQPARLVRGLLDAVRRRGVTVYEGTEVTAIQPGRAVTRHATLRADVVLRCLEGYTAGLPDSRRDWLPMNSSMVVTEPLPASVWSEIGWQGADLVGDGANAYSYAQRTADGRIAIGGRGRPYRFGSSTDRAGEIPDATVRQLRARLTRLFPVLADVRLDGAWTGVFGVARDWAAAVHCDRHSGLCWAGGYAGEGVAAANLAGRTLRDLIRGRDTELARMPWVGHQARGWEPEPLRWLAVQTVYGAFRAADALEDRTGRPSRLALAADTLAGR